MINTSPLSILSSIAFFHTQCLQGCGKGRTFAAEINPQKTTTMRTKLFLLLAALGTLSANADTRLDSLSQRLRLFGERIPQEKVYVHLDNTSYFLGDTIWFAAYTRRTNNDHPSRISRVLYAELWNHDGYLVERKLIEMKHGRGSGFFELPDTLYGGFYELRAYTRWQLNWGQTEHPHKWTSELWFYSKAMAKEYYRDYDKLYSRVFPVYDKPKAPGEYYHDMTLRPLRRYFKDDAKPSELCLSLFPEGGNLVAGVPCRVAFEAATTEGEYQEGTLSLKKENEEWTMDNALGQHVSSVATINRGRGVFTFTPEAGRKYTAIFTAKDGRSIKATLPRAEEDGVALSVDREGDTYTIKVHAQGKPARQPLGMTIMHEGVLKHFEEIGTSSNSATQVRFTPASAREGTSSGVHQVTVFDADGHIHADRLFFVTDTALSAPTLAISGIKEQYAPFEAIDLQVAATSMSERTEGEPAHISLAVRDAAHSDNTFDSGNILTEMLLASEIKGFVPHPGYFFEKDDKEHRMALDLLMMTQGWRRFNWQEMAVKGAFELRHPAEQSQMVTGTVNKYYTDATEDKDFAEVLKAHYALLDGENYNIHGDRPSSTFEERSRVDHDATASQKTATNKDYNALTRYSENKRNAVQRSERYFYERGNLNREVRVHAEFFMPEDPKNGVVGDVDTQKGTFRLELPRFEGQCVFFLAASDTTKWGKHRTFNWVEMTEDENERLRIQPEYYVRLNFPYPRFVKPYTFYQVNNASLSEDHATKAALQTDGTHLMDQLTVRMKYDGQRRLDLSKPAYVKDAYDVFNDVMDAGLYTHFTNSNELALAAACTYIGDMGMDRMYDLKLYYDSLPMSIITQIDWKENRFQPTSIAHGDRRRYQRLEYLNKIYVYSDYSPRREGDARYEQENQPSVEISLHRYPDWSRRVTYRDRRYVLDGFACQEDFYHPDYRRNPPAEGQKDYRRTLYWNPDLQLDAEGKARVTLFNNSQTTVVSVEAEGQAKDGTLLHTK